VFDPEYKNAHMELVILDHEFNIMDVTVGTANDISINLKFLNEPLTEGDYYILTTVDED